MTFEEQLKDDIGWLMVLCPEMPPLEQIEPGAQALGIAQSMRKEGATLFDQKEILKLAIAGWLGMKARQVDEPRFQKTLPFAFIHIANHLVDPKDNGENYQKLIRKLSV